MPITIRLKGGDSLILAGGHDLAEAIRTAQQITVVGDYGDRIIDCRDIAAVEVDLS